MCQIYLAVRNDPKQGYYLESDKLCHVWKLVDDPADKAAFEAEGIFNINYSHGQNYLGSSMGSDALKKELLGNMDKEW